MLIGIISVSNMIQAFLRFILSTGVRSVRKYWEGQRVDYKCF